jgi:predicted  nucleic acid-binding Zn-ribbon protein
MNKHFEDTKYYVKRAGETAKEGISEELEPIQERVQALRGEEEPEPGRVEEIRADLADLRDRAEGEAKEAIETAREKLDQVREEPAD